MWSWIRKLFAPAPEIVPQQVWLNSAARDRAVARVAREAAGQGAAVCIIACFPDQMVATAAALGAAGVEYELWRPAATFADIQRELRDQVRFDHRDPRHHDASVIQRLRSLRVLFAEVVGSPDHKETRAIARRRLKATEAAIQLYESSVARGEIGEIADVQEPTHAENLRKIQEMLARRGIEWTPPQ